LWQKAIIVAAGPLINFLFAILILAGFYMALGHPYTPPVVANVVAGSPAAAAGIRPGDRIVSIDGSDVERFEDIINTVLATSGAPMDVVIARDGTEKALVIVPKMMETTDRFGNVMRHGRLGIGRGPQVVRDVGPVTALVYGVKDTGGIIANIAGTLRQVIMGERSLTEFAGPVKVGQVTGQQASLGVLSFIAFMAFFSINLGFINLLYAVEAIRRQPISAKIQEWAFMSGFAALMSLMVVLTWNDLGSVGVWERLSGWLG
jgi:regulator of sigma E protease